MKTVMLCLGLTLLVQSLFLASHTAISSAYWVWSLRLAINDLKFYPDQVFPALSYPVDFDAVTFPANLNDIPIQVPKGAEVSWINRDRNPSDEGEELTIISHLIQVKSQEQKVIAQSPLLSKLGESFTVRFDEPGDFTYHCFLHPQMRGKITVSPWSAELVERN
jgi:hypothetical protein